MKTLLLIVSLVYILMLLIRMQFPIVEIELNLFEEFRNYLSSKLTTLLPSPQAELLAGILLGQRSDMPAHFQLALRDTSTLHMVVVSGQNITLLSGMVLSILAGLFNRRHAILITLAVIVVYVLITGAQIPVLRAAIMAVIVFLAQYLGRQREGIIALFVSALILLLVNPNWIASISFQLSFLATFGVIVVAPILEKSLFNNFPRFISQDLSITLGAQLMVLPVIAHYFHQISIVGVITNLLVGWTIPFIMIIGGVLSVVSLVFSPLAQMFAWVLNIPLTYFVYVVQFSSKLPFAWEYVGEFNLIFWIGYYFLLLGMVQLLYAQTKTGTGSEEDSANPRF